MPFLNLLNFFTFIVPFIQFVQFLIKTKRADTRQPSVNVYHVVGFVVVLAMKRMLWRYCDVAVSITHTD